MTTHFAPLKIPVAHTVELTDPEDPTIDAEDFSMFYTELKYVKFCLFGLNLVAMATPFAPLKI